MSLGLADVDWRTYAANNVSQFVGLITTKSAILNDLNCFQQSIDRMQTAVNESGVCSGEKTLQTRFFLMSSEYRKQGIGSMMLMDIIEYCKYNEIQIFTLILPSDKNTFSKLGFTLLHCDECLYSAHSIKLSLLLLNFKQLSGAYTQLS